MLLTLPSTWNLLIIVLQKGGEDGEEEEEEEGVDPKYLETQRRLQEEARERNRSEFGEEGEAARLRLEGFRAGLYVRLVLKNVPVEFVKVRLFAIICYLFLNYQSPLLT